MNPLGYLKNLLATRLLREAEKKITKEGKMVRKEKEEENQSYQLQLDLFEFDRVREGKPSKEVARVETMPAEATGLREFVKAEKNLEWLGFFTPSSNWTKDAKKKVISLTATVEGKKVKASATILPSAEYGLPDTADLDKYRAFQKILSDELIRNGQVPKHITFTSADLIEAMGKKRRGGEIYEEIKSWLIRMKLTGIQSEGAVWLAGKKMWVSDTVSVFDRVIACGQTLEDGTIADCHHIWLSDWMLENINGLYLLSIDYELHKQLRKPIAKSLLPVLQIGFYASGGTYTKRYDALCQFLGIKPHKKFSYIKQQLNPSFEDLQDKGFLAKWRSDVDLSAKYAENKLHKTYNITWKAGDRFYEAQELLQEREEGLMELSKRKPKRITRPKPKQDEAQQDEAKQTGRVLSASRFISEVKAEAVSEPKTEETAESDFEPKQEKETKTTSQTPELPKQQPELAPPDETKEDNSLVAKLVAHNVSKIVAEDLVKRFDPKVIGEWTKAIHYADAHDRAAYLVKAIKENWLVPEKYLGAKEREEAAKRYEEQRQRERVETERKMQAQKEEAEKMDGIYNSLPLEQKEEVDKEAGERLPNLVKAKIEEGQTDSPMVQGTLLVKKREVVKEWIEADKIKVDDPQRL